MDSAVLAGQIGVAGLSLGAFSVTLDLIHAVQDGLGIWEQFSNLDDDVKLFRTQLLLQHDILDSWVRDWYGSSTQQGPSIGKLRLLRTHGTTVHRTLESLRDELKKILPLKVLENHAQTTPTECMLWGVT